MVRQRFAEVATGLFDISCCAGVWLQVRLPINTSNEYLEGLGFFGRVMNCTHATAAFFRNLVMFICQRCLLSHLNNIAHA